MIDNQYRKPFNSNDIITFEKFMRLSLYDPQFGYYQKKENIFGYKGDFFTAPEISHLFSKTLAHQCHEVLKNLDGNILEFGAGTGKMGAVIMKELFKLKSSPKKYQIIELSPKLIEIQRNNILNICPELIDNFEWLTELPSNNWNGIILANEVIDAMPVHKFKKAENIKEYYVDTKDNKLCWHIDNISNNIFIPKIQDIIDKYLSDTDSYDIEINFYLEGWLKSIYNFLNKGSIIIIDYGFPDSEFYHTSRSTGTIMCHYQQTTHTNPLINVGQQDITAHVNFSHIAEYASDIGFSVSGYTNQAAFLLNGNILDLVSADDDIENYNQTQQIKILTLPSEMGELFKVMNLNKNIEPELSGFSDIDLRHSL